jgi:hypothetical protein
LSNRSPLFFQQRESVLINQLATQYRALGWQNDNRVQELRIGERAKRRAVEREGRMREQEFRTRVGVAQNKLQKSFREQVLY